MIGVCPRVYDIIYYYIIYTGIRHIHVFTNLIVIDTQMCCVCGAMVINHYRKKCNGGKMHRLHYSDCTYITLVSVASVYIKITFRSNTFYGTYIPNTLRLLSKRLHRNWTESVSISF